ncbi:MAG: Ppx/GppA family phosphatase [Gemmatimonadaceae bacterium]|nr:Ppx/GppA family phosphatase [Gemmatimonadaceae bacterium]
MPARSPRRPTPIAPLSAIPTSPTRRATPTGTPAFGAGNGDAGAVASRRIAAIDIGSNSIRAIVADVSASGQIRTVDEMKAAPRLSTGVDETGHLSVESALAAIEALQRMVTLARQLGAERIECVATSAVRDATDGAAFVRQVKKLAGLTVRVISGEDEARLSFRSAQAHFDVGHGRMVTCDIGGGSVELALSADGLVERLLSMPFGAIRATETYLRKGTRRASVNRLRKALRDEIRERFAVKEWRGAGMIGSGGTFTNVAGMLLARQRVGTARTVHGKLVTRGELEHLLDQLIELSPAERLTVPGLNPARADIIVAGMAVAAEVMAYLDIREFHASAYGIREGLLLEAAEVAPQTTDPGEGRRRSVQQFAERTQYEEPHAKHVQKLALQLFDAIGIRIGCTPADRETLRDAALLHDTGYHISYNDHHKHAYHLIVHADLLGVSPEEQVVMANVARYHRGSPPKLKHPTFAELTREQQLRVRRLAAMLRVADGFDRGHIGAVQQIKVRWTERALRLTPVPDPRARSTRLELWGASRKADLLEKLIDLPVLVIGPDGKPVEWEGTDSVD